MTTKPKKKSGKQALKGKRAPATFERDPDDLYVETNPADPYFDPRSLLPVTDEQLETWSIAGQTKDIIIRKNGEREEVIDGHQTRAVASAHNARQRANGLPTVMVVVKLKRLPDVPSVLLFRQVAQLRRKSLPSMVAHAAHALDVTGTPHDRILLVMDDLKDKRDLALHLKFHALGPEAKKAVDEKRIKMARAVALFGHLRLDQQADVVCDVLDREEKPTEKLLTPDGKTGHGRPPASVIKRMAALEAPGADDFATGVSVALEYVAGKSSKYDFLELAPWLKGAFVAEGKETTDAE